MTTILRFILFILLAPAFAVVAQAAGTFQDDLRIVDTGFQAETVVQVFSEAAICNYDSSGALLQQRSSLDGEDDQSGYQKLETSGAEMLLFAFSTEFRAANTTRQLEFKFVDELADSSGLVIGRGRHIDEALDAGAFAPGEYRLSWFRGSRKGVRPS